MMASRIFVLNLLLCLGLCHNHEEQTVAQFLWDMMSQTFPKCSLVLAHDFDHLPAQFQNIMNRMAQKFRFSLTFRVPNSFEVPHHRAVHELWDFYERRKKAGQCVVHFVTSDTVRGFRRLSVFEAFSITVDTSHDYFVIWIRRESSKKAMQLDIADGWSFKVAVESSPKNQSSLDIYTSLFYCKPGDSRIVFLGRYPHGIPMTPVAELFPDATMPFNDTHINIPGFYDITSEEVEAKAQKIGMWKLPMIELALYIIGRQLKYRWTVYSKDISPEEIYQSRMSNGSWKGHIGELVNKRAHYLPLSFIQDDAMTHVKFGFPFFYTGFAFVRAYPGPVWSWETIFWPYDAAIWLCITFGTVIGVFAGWFILKHQASGNKESSLSQLMFVAQYLLQSFLEQLPNREVPSSNSFRVFVAFWLYFAMVITCGYQEAVFSFVAVPKKEVLPKTFEELLSMEYEVGAEQINGLVYSVFIRDLDLPIHQAIKENLVLHSTYRDCFMRCSEHKSACLGVASFLSSELWNMADRNGHIKYYHNSEVAVNVYTGAAYRNDYPSYAATYRFAAYFFESGSFYHYANMIAYSNLLRALQRERNKHRPENNDEEEEESAESEEEGHHPLSKKHLYGPFGLIVAGWILCLVAFGYEMVRNRCTKCVGKRSCCKRDEVEHWTPKYGYLK